MQAAWTRIVDAIREPVQLRVEPDGTRYIQVLGLAIYSLDPQSVIRTFLWRARADLLPQLQHSPEHTMCVDGAPWRQRWLDHWQEAFAMEVAYQADRQGLQVEMSLAREYAAWAFAIFRRRIRRGCDLRLMRGCIARALALDPVALLLARQLRMATRGLVVDAQHYNEALAHIQAHRKLQRDAPTLHLSYALLCHGRDWQAGCEPVDQEPLQRLRLRVKAHGLGTRMYRLLLEGGTRLWRPMLRFYEKGNAEAAWDYLALIDTLGWRQCPDPAFMQLVLALCGSSASRRASYRARYAPFERELRKLVRRFEEQDATERKAMLAHLPTLLRWLHYTRKDKTKHRARLPAWETMLRQSTRWEREQLQLAQALPGPWPVPVIDEAAARAQGLRVVFLTTAAQLHEEGQAMRHCALTKAQECDQGRVAVASIRDERSGKRIGTALWRRERRQWKIAQVVGFANGSVGDRVREGLGATRTRSWESR